MPLEKYNIFISAGEQSGDIHSSMLVEELKLRLDNNVVFNGLGGDNLSEHKVKLLYHIKELATVGLWDVAKKYNFFKKALKETVNFIRKDEPDAVILCDYPGFNLRLAEELRKFYKGKIIYYIAPQIWAWNTGRVRKLKKYIDKVLVVFPFEVEFYNRFGVNAIYTGHPLVRRIERFKQENQKSHKVFGVNKVITILPGSRMSEIHYHMPVLLETAKQLQKEFDTEINFSRARGLPESAFINYKNELKDFNLSGDDPYKLIYNSDAVLAKAGTSTVECALLETPCLIFYKTNILNYRLLKPFVKVNHLGMVNILSGKDVVKEFIQKDFTKEKILFETKKLLTDTNYRNKIISEFREIRQKLGEKDSAQTAAEIIANEISR